MLRQRLNAVSFLPEIRSACGLDERLDSGNYGGTQARLVRSELHVEHLALP